MHKRMYRFEIVRGVSNAVYEATDPARGSTVTLYEWTPEAEALERSLKVLDGLPRSEEYEVFSSGASLYLAAPDEPAGEAALRRLREAGLFQGTFGPRGPAAPPPPPPPPPAASLVESEKQVVPVWLRVVLVVVFFFLLGLWLLGVR